MELLEGQTLGSVMQAGPLPVARAVSLLLPALDAVIAAHDKGIIHRDIKPDNIFVSHTAQGAPLVKVIDFGLSKLVAEPGERDRKLTRSGATLGTPSYMAPEQIRGADRVDARADVYSFGVVLYEMLSGRLPFDAAGEDGAEGGALEAAAFGLESLESARPGLAGELCSVVMKALAHDAAERFQDLRSLRASIAPFAQPDRPLAPAARTLPRAAPETAVEAGRFGVLESTVTALIAMLIIGLGVAAVRS
jgi:serine/threonine-protein kinase